MAEYVAIAKVVLLFMQILKDKKAGEKATIEDVERAVIAAGVKEKDVKGAKELLPLLGEVVEGFGDLFKK